MKPRFLLLFALLGGFVLMGADGCSSDPNVEGAKLDLRNKDYDRALENLETAIQNNPENAEAYELKGQVLQEKAQTVRDAQEHEQMVEEMVAAYNRAVELDPTLEEAVTRQLRIAYVQEFQSGVQAFNRGNTNDDASELVTAAQYFDNAAMLQPDSAGAYVNQAFALINAGEGEAAIVPFEAAIEGGEQTAENYIFLADLYTTYDRAGDAVVLLEDAIGLFPQNTDVQAQLLNAYMVSGQMDQAMERYQQFVENDPNNKIYRYNYGSLLLEAEQYEEAITQLAKAVELDPSYGNAQYNLGAAYVNRAVDLNERISEMDDELREQRSEMSQDEITALEAEMAALADQRTELFESAIPHLEEAKSLFEAEGNDPAGICGALFSAYVQTGQDEQARTIAECAGYEIE